MLFPDLVEIIDPEPHSAPLNMAIDEALLRATDRPALRIYAWEQPALSFGYFGKLDDALSMAAGRTVVRRWTGGGMVEHGADLTYTLVVPRGHAFTQHNAAESYRLIHETIARLLIAEGESIEVAATVERARSNACFTSPVQFDLLHGGAKIAGAAQRRTRSGLLHQGSIYCPSLRTTLSKNLGRALGAKLDRQRLSEQLEQDAQVLVATRYGTVEWLRKF